jgi:hypothetical protein
MTPLARRSNHILVAPAASRGRYSSARARDWMVESLDLLQVRQRRHDMPRTNDGGALTLSTARVALRMTDAGTSRRSCARRLHIRLGLERSLGQIGSLPAPSRSRRPRRSWLRRAKLTERLTEPAAFLSSSASVPASTREAHSAPAIAGAV